jgi:hypothetical protein
VMNSRRLNRLRRRRGSAAWSRLRCRARPRSESGRLHDWRSAGFSPLRMRPLYIADGIAAAPNHRLSQMFRHFARWDGWDSGSATSEQQRLDLLNRVSPLAPLSRRERKEILPRCLRYIHDRGPYVDQSPGRVSGTNIRSCSAYLFAAAGERISCAGDGLPNILQRATSHIFDNDRCSRATGVKR